MREPKTIDVLLLILLGAIWGSAFFNIKIATYTYCLLYTSDAADE